MGKQPQQQQNQPNPDENPEEPQIQEEPGAEGFPEHGDELRSARQQQDDDQGGDPDPNPEDETVTLTKAELDAFKEQQAEIMRMLKNQQPAQPTPQQQPTPQSDAAKVLGMTQAEFEQTFWDNPAEMFQRMETALLEKVRGETTKQSGQTQFWTDFYMQNTDLKEDRDLVELTLNQNMKTLADMPVAEASKKLADLTRQRIMRYTGEQNGGSRRAKPPHTEGTEHRVPQKRKPEQETKPMSLGELIKARKAARRNSGKAVAT